MAAAQCNWSRISGALCALTLGCILLAGLWPFGNPPNDIAWLAGHSGIHFGKLGTLLSAAPLPDRKAAWCSIEMWLRPDRTDLSATLLAFYNRDGLMGQSLHQSLGDLRLDWEASHNQLVHLYADNVLRGGSSVFLTVVFGQGTARVYRDGVPIRRASGFPLRPGACQGSFVVGDSPVENSSWQGDLRGLAIYQHELTEQQARSNYEFWSRAGHPSEAAGTPDALYLFDEQGGRLVRDHGVARVNLTIPERYVIANQILLESPWHAFEPTRSYVKDLVINIAGFIPFGLTLSGFLVLSGGLRRPTTGVVLTGLLLSLTIEILQSHLPTRDSDITDVLTNTLGAWFGTVLYGWTRRLIPALDRSSI